MELLWLQWLSIKLVYDYKCIIKIVIITYYSFFHCFYHYNLIMNKKLLYQIKCILTRYTLPFSLGGRKTVISLVSSSTCNSVQVEASLVILWPDINFSRVKNLFQLLHRVSSTSIYPWLAGQGSKNHLLGAQIHYIHHCGAPQFLGPVHWDRSQKS